MIPVDLPALWGYSSSSSNPSGLHGVVKLYNGNQEEWIEYAERLEKYFVANELEDVAKRRAILLNGVGL